MENLRFSFLTAQDMPVLHQTFLQAFSDYIVPIQLNQEQFQSKLQREGIDPHFCVAAYNGDQMIGFILTGLGEWQGKPTAYNGGTGVIPAFRGQKLTQKLYTFLIQKLLESGIEYSLLEVIDQNLPALKSYQRIGMQITRTLNCYRVKVQNLSLRSNPEIQIKRAHKPDWNAYQLFWDITPSWQNSNQAIDRSINDATILEAYDNLDLLGYLILYPKSGAVAQLAVSKNARTQGVGQALLREASLSHQSQALMCTNVDTKGQGINVFFERCNFTLFLKQYEMKMQLA